MATIKTQLVGSERRIITKSGLISCSCCDDAGCCMYPAQGLLDGDYLAADLPDSVLVSIGSFSETYTKNGSIYEFDNSTLEPVIFPAGTNARWAFFLDGDEVGDRSEPCLIAAENAQQVTDFFEDTYTVSYSNPSIASTSVTRQSLCVWEGQTTFTPPVGPAQSLTVILEYTDNPDDEDHLKWAVNGDPKNGTQNTPVGSYQSGDATWTVA
jgi:hypothetical protein